MTPPDFTKELSDLTGKVAIVTGATSGLGYATARELLRKGATVYLATRNESKTVATISRLQAEGLGPGNGKPVWHKLELDNPHDVKTSAEEFLKRESRLDILVNNAACLGKAYAMGPIGVQDMATINHISPFLFTKLLLPLLKKTAQDPENDVRIVNVGSDGHRFVGVDQFKSKADLNGPSTSNSYYAQLKRYFFTRLLTALWTKELARRLADSKDDHGSEILVLHVHPGSTASEGAFEGASRLPWPLSTLGCTIIRWTFSTPTQAATTVLVAAAKPDLRREKEKYQGGYLVPFGELGSISKTASDEELAKSLWELTENILGDEGL